MCGGNAAEVDRALARLIGDLQEMRAAVTTDPARRLTPILTATGELRRSWPVRSGSVSEIPVGVGELLDLGRAGGWVTAVAGN
jgi:prephenate dehydrogenase